MKKMRIIYLIFFSLVPFCSFAQKDTLNTDVKKITSSKEEMSSVDSLKKEIIVLSSQISKLRIDLEKSTKNSHSMNLQINKLNQQIRCQERKLIFADSVIARLSNDCLKFKYDENRVRIAIDNFSKMYSIKLQKTFSPLLGLLENYAKYTKEIRDILLLAEQDKSLENPFLGSKQASSYIAKLKETSYYRNVYNSSWTIPYLNTCIDKAIERINKFNPKVNKKINLQELLNK